MPKKRKLTLVLDTNVWISAKLWKGQPFRIVKAAEEDRVGIIISEELVKETSRALTYPRMKHICEETGVSPSHLIDAILKVAQLVEVKSRFHVVHEDSADNKIIECAIDGKADFIVSGDAHLTKIGRYKKTRIVSVRQMLEIIGQECQC